MLKEKKKIYFFIMFSIIGILLALVFNRIVINDEMEHLRMSWLVSLGEVPYRDFFEHHHPLLWYLFAPVITILPHNVLLVFYTAKILSFLCSVVTYYIIYIMIKRFLGGTNVALCFFAMLFTFYPIWYGTSLFKPDIFARLFYFSGLYLFFCYIETQKTKELILCAINFTISFLFIQTTVLNTLPLIIPVGIIIYKKPQKIKDFIKASICPMIILGGCVGLLIYSNSFKEYYQLNWILNSHLPGVTRIVSSKIWEQIIPLITAVIILIWRGKNKQLSVYEKIIGLLFVTEFLQRIYIPAIYTHYLILLLILAALIIAPVIEKVFINPEYKQVRSFFYIFLMAMLCINFITLYYENNQKMLPFYEKINADETETVIYITPAYVPIYTKKASYYGVHNNIHRLDDFLFHRFPEYNINKLIKDEKPKYVVYRVKAKKKKSKTDRFNLRPEILEDYTEITPDLYQRKETVEK